MSDHAGHIVPYESDLEAAFTKLSEAESSYSIAMRQLRDATEGLDDARRHASEEMAAYFVGKHVKVTAHIEEETAYDVSEAGFRTSPSNRVLRDQDVVIKSAGVKGAHHRPEDIQPRLTFELLGGPANRLIVKARLDSILKLEEVSESLDTEPNVDDTSA